MTLDLKKEMIEVRHYLHENPELSFAEVNTSKFIFETLKKHNIKAEIIVNTGVMAVIEGEQESDDILLRADIDALPICEATNLPFASKNGAMHACGHDIHTTVLLGSIIWLSENRDKFSGRVIAIFQPGEEESPGGASMILSEGILDGFNIKAAYALHTAHDMATGYLGCRVGEYMATTSEVHITVNGQGGHAALPTSDTNPVIDSARVILALKALTKEYERIIIAIGRVEASGSTNVIPNKVVMAGTMRSMSIAQKNELKERIKSIVLDINDKAEVRFTDGYPPVYNNPELSEKSIDIFRKTFGEDKILELGLRMTADDFGFFSQIYPSFYFRLGVKGDWGDESKPHTSLFMADDNSISVGMEAMINLVLNK